MDPVSAYAERLASARARAADRAAVGRRLSWARLATAATALGCLGLAFDLRWIHPAWCLAPLGVFAVLVAVHRRVAHEEGVATRLSALWHAGIDRLEGRWAGRGPDGAGLLESDHPLAADVDLIGPGSLLQRIAVVRTDNGQRQLATWLGTPARPAEIAARQVAVAELRARLELRERASLAGEAAADVMTSAPLADWAKAGAVGIGAATAAIAGTASAATAVAIVGWAVGAWGPGPFLLILLVQAVWGRRQRAQVRGVLRGLHGAAHDLGLAAEMLGLLEAETFSSPWLQSLRDGVASPAGGASGAIEHLKQLVALLDSRLNMVFAPLAALLQWDLQLAAALTRWRRQHGDSVGEWLDAVGRFEAILSLAAFAFENPGDPFPELLDGAPRLVAEGLAHPLIPPSQAVGNDFHLGGDAPQALIVSGSNMSGKSTLLRALGCNLALAFAGGPVRATRLAVTPLAVWASIEIHDSLLDGRSRFYAEILRLRQVVEAARNGGGVLFLLDEVLGGTNSHDRRLGAEALVRALVDTGAIGLVTTHDLALTRLAEALVPRVANVHFVDRIVDGEPRFEYRLHAGPVSHGNALELMRAVGLPVGARAPDDG